MPAAPCSNADVEAGRAAMSMSSSVRPGWAGRAVAALAATISIGAHAAPGLPALAAQVERAERAFARSMAERDLPAFAAHLSEQAVFFDAREALHGKAAVLAAWRAYFDGPQAPFSWAPDRVEVLGDGSLALSTGPVRDPAGRPIARFDSVWRQEAPGVWRIVFDKGQPWSE
jgi:ketosteroid isomerase-like protein